MLDGHNFIKGLAERRGTREEGSCEGYRSGVSEERKLLTAFCVNQQGEGQSVMSRSGAKIDSIKGTVNCIHFYLLDIKQ